MRSGDWKPNRFDRVKKYNHVCLRRNLLSQRDQFHKPFRTQEQLFVDMKPPERKQTSGRRCKSKLDAKINTKRTDHSLQTHNRVRIKSFNSNLKIFQSQTNKFPKS